MLTLSAALANSLGAKDKELRYTMEIAGFNNSAGKVIILASGPVVVAGSDVVTLLQPVTDSAARIDLDGFRTTFAGIGFSVLDKDDFITSRFDDFNFIGKTATLKVGVADVAFADYLTVYQGAIKAVQFSGTPRAYSFRTVDVQENLNQFVFVTAKSKLSADITDAATMLTVDDVAGFNLAGPFTNYEPVSVARGHVIVGSGSQAEVIEWRGKSGSDLITLQRAQFGTTAKAHVAGEDVLELVAWPGHPLEILAVILSGSSLDEPVGFETVPSTWKMGTTVTLDVASWRLARDRTQWAIWEYRTTQKVFARNFAEQEAMRPLHLFLRASVTNTLSVSVFIDRPIPLEAARKLVKDQIHPELEWSDDGERISNRVTVEHDFDPVTGLFTETSEFNDAASQAAFGVRRPTTFSLRGLRNTHAADQAEIVAKEHFKVFAALAPIATIKAFLRQLDMEPGDTVKIMHPQLPKREAGIRGEVDHFLKILERSILYFGPSVRLKVYDADIPASNKYGSIAPDGTPDFPLASAADQKNLVFLDQSFKAA